MAELGVLAVGPAASALRLSAPGLPVHRICADPIVPLEADMPALAKESALALFDGADADRWRVVPDRDLPERSAMLWAASQVDSAGPARAAQGWDRVLIIGWADEDALLPAVRALAGRTLTVLLGGRVRPEDPRVRRNHAVLCELVRQGGVASLVHVDDPEAVLEVAVDAARNPVTAEPPRPKAVDIGPYLDVRATWALPAQPVGTHRLVHVPLGRATQLPQLVVDLAAHQALRSVFGGPPVDVEGVPVVDLEALRAELPEGDVFERFRTRLLRALDTVELVGEEPLVEQIARALRPGVAAVRSVLQKAEEIESHRVLRLKAFGAAGIGYTEQRLRAQLDDVGDLQSRWTNIDLNALLDGDVEPDEDGSSALAWRHTFAGVPSFVVRRGSPGWQVARDLVKDRFASFKAEFASAVASAVELRVRAARDPNSPLPRASVLALHERAVRVRDALQRALVAINGRVLAGCEIALRQDGLLRWVAGDPERLRGMLEHRLDRYAITAELERTATVSFTRRPLGMANAADFDGYVTELSSAAEGLAREASAIPAYSDVLLALVDDRDPEELRRHLTRAEGMDPVLSLRKNTPSGLLAWFQRTGMRIEVRASEPCAIYWADAHNFSSPQAELGRNGAAEHRLADLILPPPEGDSPSSLAALAQSIVLLVTGLVVGELSIQPDEGMRALVVRGAGLPDLAYLPHGAVHHLASDAAVRGTLAAAVQRRLDGLAGAPDAEEALLKLVELASLGPSTRVRAQLGLDHSRYKHLMPAITTLLERNAQRAVVAVLDHVRVDELRAMSRPPSRHAMVDVLQLCPLGVG